MPCQPMSVTSPHYCRQEFPALPFSKACCKMSSSPWNPAAWKSPGPGRKALGKEKPWDRCVCPSPSPSPLQPSPLSHRVLMLRGFSVKNSSRIATLNTELRQCRCSISEGLQAENAMEGPLLLPCPQRETEGMLEVWRCICVWRI